MKKLIALSTLLFSMTGCQIVSPIFVDYHGVRMDVAQWINQQSLLSMQQKRSLAQLSRAQQKLVKIDQINEQDKVKISSENAIAYHCANLHLTPQKINQLQEQVFGTEKPYILEKFSTEFPLLKIDTSNIQCD